MKPEDLRQRFEIRIEIEEAMDGAQAAIVEGGDERESRWPGSLVIMALVAIVSVGVTWLLLRTSPPQRAAPSQGRHRA